MFSVIPSEARNLFDVSVCAGDLCHLGAALSEVAQASLPVRGVAHIREQTAQARRVPQVPVLPLGFRSWRRFHRYSVIDFWFKLRVQDSTSAKLE
jgi:hypothetical protein